MKTFVLCFILLAFFFELSQSDQRIKNVVALMFENRSFDHLLGHLKKINPKIDGLTGKEFNYENPADPNSRKVYVKFDAEPYIGVNPDHSIPGTAIEMFGHSTTKFYTAPMDGFVFHNKEDNVMQAYNQSTVPAVSTLAMNFALFDKFYSSVPGPTDVNRGYFLSGTSHGRCINPSVGGWVDGYFPQKTFFNQLAEANVPFKIYFSDFPMALEFDEIRKLAEHIHTIDDFFDDVAAGTLPAFSYLEPRWFDLLEWKENDQHPPHSTTYGEYLLKDTYDSLRKSSIWNSTLLYVSYDEHGGLYDHVPPPFLNIPNPDGRNCSEAPLQFDFEMLGVRVPTIVASPWVDTQVVGEPANSHFDHTSMMKTVRRLFNMTSGPLTNRDAWSASFESILRPFSAGPRTDTPQELPVADLEHYRAYRKFADIPTTDKNVQAMLAAANPKEIENSPLINELQQDVAIIAWSLGMDKEPFNPGMTVHEAAFYVRDQLDQFLTKKKN